MKAQQEPASRSRRYDHLARAHSRHGRKHRRRGWRRWLAPLLAVAGVAGLVLLYVLTADEPAAPVAEAPPAAAQHTLERTAALPPLNLPADDAPHGQGMEWWYHSGIVDSASGQRYAFHIAVFVANSLIKHTVMHAALTDLQSGRRYTGQTRTGGLPARNDAAAGFDFRQEGWLVAGNGPLHNVDLQIQDATLKLSLRDTAPVVAHRAADSQTPGLLDFGDSGISYYYSRPRMAASGEISLDGGPKVPVSGQVWFDHQWGDFDPLSLGWTWLALHLKDGSDLMVYELFDRQGQPVMTAGTLTRNGQSVALRPNDIVLTPTTAWTSPRTRTHYVVGWQVQVPQTGTLEVQAMLPDSEFDASVSSNNLYWEGPVRVGGSAQGHGFLELSGYERLKTPRAAAR